MHVIVGSSAVEDWEERLELNFSILGRSAGDLDVWTDGEYPKALKLDKVDMPTYIIELVPHEDNYATLDAVYTIKCSHLGWDIFWNKHCKDVIKLAEFGCRIIPELYEALVEYWKQTKGNVEQLSMKKSKEDFFTDSVNYVYDHDYLHELVAYPNAPVYTYCLKDGEDVLISKDKFDNMPFEQQVRMFREEISVIAAERWLINPSAKKDITPYKAYKYALRKTCTTLTKNWATRFIVLNMKHFCSPDESHFRHMLHTIEEGEEIMGRTLSREEHNEIFEEMFEIYEREARDRWGANEMADYISCFFTDKDHDKGYLKGLVIEKHEIDTSEYGGSSFIAFRWKGNLYKLDYESDSYGNGALDWDLLKETELVQKTIYVYE